MLYAIGDLHLSEGLDGNKKMDKFGEEWVEHSAKIFSNLENLKDDDTLLILGDTSWATKLADAKIDLNILEKFKGKKYVIQGNHDYWWTNTSKLNDMFNINFVKHGYFPYEDYAICAIKGSLCPNNFEFTEHNEKLYNRECGRLENSLQKAYDDGYKKFIVIMHYPPTNEKKEKSKYIDIIEKFQVEKVLYGHLHGKDNFDSSLMGIHNNVKYMLVSSDYLNFEIKKIL